MSKELEALREIKMYGCGDAYCKDIFERDLNIIETALKEKNYNEELLGEYEEKYAEYQEMFRMFPYKETSVRGILIVLTQLGIKDSDTLLKKLKALEIIKKKELNLLLFKSSIDLRDYNYTRIKENELTQEEFDLLKEVLL